MKRYANLINFLEDDIQQGLLQPSDIVKVVLCNNVIIAYYDMEACLDEPFIYMSVSRFMFLLKHSKFAGKNSIINPSFYLPFSID